MARLSFNGRALLTALVANVAMGIFLTPLGPFETRPVSALRSFAWPATFAAGMILNISSSLALFARAREASVLAIIASIFFIVPIAADQVGWFMSLPPPPAISILELATVVVAAVVIFYGSKVYRVATAEKLLSA